MRKTENYLFYENYKWDKCDYTLYKNRVYRWMIRKDAIKPKNKICKILPKTNVTFNWRVCTKCLKNLWWISFCKNRNGTNWYDWVCRDCKNQYRRERREVEWVREKEREKEKEYRKNNKELYKLNFIFYWDKQVRKNMKIQWKLRKHSEAKLDKYYYFLSKWYDRKKLKEIFKIKN